MEYFDDKTLGRHLQSCSWNLSQRSQNLCALSTKILSEVVAAAKQFKVEKKYSNV